MEVTKLELIGKIESYEDRVTAAVLVPKEDGVVAISHDRTIKVWMKRSTGQYWPSISHTLSAAPTCMDFDLMTRRLLVGMESGAIMDFEVSEDYNKLTKLGECQAHEGSVKCIGVLQQWVLSCGQDSRLVLHSLNSHTLTLTNQIRSPGLCLTCDNTSDSVYIGDSSGTITVLKLSLVGFSVTNSAVTNSAVTNSAVTNSVEKVTLLNRHTEGVVRLLLDVSRQRLYSASLDHTIICWDTSLNPESLPISLTGHTQVVRGLGLSASGDQLISVAEDSKLLVWDMTFNRQPAAEWSESNVCEICSSPFFWNFRSMWESKSIGVRQHHCRRCGKALCSHCTPHTDPYPLMGFELPQRTCDQCHQLISEHTQDSQRTTHSLYHISQSVDLDQTSKTILTVGKDRVIKIWDARNILKH